MVSKLSLLTLSLALPLLGQSAPSLLEKRGDHKTELTEKLTSDQPLATPPADHFEQVTYPSPIGDIPAYLSTTEVDGKPEKSPAIIWLTGGFPGTSPSAYLWEHTDTSNEQSARIYRYKGVTTLFPHLRGRSVDAPGQQEMFYGEVHDVIAAHSYLAQRPDIDPDRIYLGGHSTGGTLALLVAASTDVFAGVISLGPTDTDYGEETAIYKWNDTERTLRAPIHHLDSIQSPTYIVEGETGNTEALAALKKASKNPNVRTTVIRAASHFSCIHQVNTYFCKRILESKDGTLDVDLEELSQVQISHDFRARESADLRILAGLRNNDVDLFSPQAITFSIEALTAEKLAPIQEKAQDHGFTANEPTKLSSAENPVYYRLHLTKSLVLSDLKSLFKASQEAQSLANEQDVYYDFWTAQN